ncbi:MAG: hypothetical protein RIR65_2204 [Planctomycetota bacterium]
MLAAIEFGDFIKFVVFFFVVVLPILRTIHEAVKTRQAESRRRAESGAPATEVEEGGDADADGDEARRAFEALMRGEDPARAPAPPPIPAAAPAVEVVSRRVERGRAGDLHREARESELPGQIEERLETRGDEARSSEGESYEEELEARGLAQPDEEELAAAENRRRIDEERSRREAFLRAERESAAGRRVTVGSAAMTSFELDKKPVETAATRPARAERATKLLGTRADLRRAVLAAEVLGRPSALREPGEGPVGLR